MNKLDNHPLSEIFPPMSEVEYQFLKDDIREHGLQVPIVVHEGKILDGRHRYKACWEIGIKPKFEIYAIKDKASDYVYSINIARRNLTLGQIACVAALRAKALKKDPVANLSRTGGQERFSADYKKKPVDRKARREHSTIAKVSREMKTGSNTVMKAMVLLNNDKELFNRVYRGEMLVHSAWCNYRDKVGTTKRPTEETITNIEAFKSEIMLPNCFDERSVIDEFIKTMNHHGWNLELQFRDGKLYAHWYGNGFKSLGASWGHVQPEFEFRRAVIVAAKEKLDKVNTSKAA